MRRLAWLVGGFLSCIVFSASAQGVTGGGSASAAGTQGTTSPAAASARQGAAPVLDRRVTLNLNGVTLSAALEEIARQARLDLSYTDEVVPLARRVSICAPTRASATCRRSQVD